ncbi:hypothetical protein AB1L30_11545 [Bremerella sp. JC817]|uniref:alpha/beta hydrolase family esterase n=1 Tax=Bremerella sp. JC817 TaxID=3231756 RepID=UPI00345B1FB7
MLRRRWLGCGLLLGASLFFFNGRNFQAAELPTPVRSGQFEVTTESGGFERTATIHIPKGYNPQSPPPLVITLHGAGGQGDSILNIDNWAKKADEKGFIVIAPNGLPARPRLPGNFLSNPYLWNSGQLREGGARSQVDDVAYIRTLLDELAKKVPYDATKVFATGHSNGGGMTFRLGAEMADRLAAIGTVAGTVSVDNPQPAKPLPSLFILGLEDPLLPYKGGESTLPWGTRTTPPIAGLMAKWATAIQCQTEPQTIAEDDAVQTVRYPSKNGGPELTVLYLKGHGHAWPGASRNLPSRLTGPNTSKLNATDEIWSFFEASTK